MFWDEGMSLTPENGVEIMGELIRAPFQHERLVSWNQGRYCRGGDICFLHWRMNVLQMSPVGYSNFRQCRIKRVI